LSRRVALAAGLALLAVTASAQVPDRLNYQGVLKKGDGTSVGQGYKDIQFRIYDAATGGNLVWARTQRANTDADGLFNVVLMESGAPIAGAQTESLATVFTSSGGENRYLELTVVGSTPIMPRQRFVTAPYAFMAINVKTAQDNFTVQGALSVMQGAQVKTLTVTENASVGGKLAIAGNPQAMFSWNSLLINNVANEDNGIVFRTRNNPEKDVQFINRQGDLRFGFYDMSGGGDLVGINRNGSTWITAAQDQTLALENTAGQDNYITLKVKGGNANNVYLANRSGNFGVNLDGRPDIFTISRTQATLNTGLEVTGKALAKDLEVTGNASTKGLVVSGETQIMGPTDSKWDDMPKAKNNLVTTVPCDGFLIVAAQNADGDIWINEQKAGGFNGTKAASFGTFPLAKGDTWKINNNGGDGGLYINWRPLLRK
jgi:hypothetical protein